MTRIEVGRASYAGVSTRTLAVTGAGPTNVLLHGFLDSADTWAGVLAGLARSGRAGVAVDLPGFGEADDLTDGPTLPQHDAFVDALVTAYAARGPVILVGNSLGALASLRAADRGLPLAGVVPIAEPSLGDSWVIRQFRVPVMRPLVRALTLQAPLPDRVHEWLYARAIRLAVLAQGRPPDPAAVSRFATFLVGKGGHAWAVRTAHALAQEVADPYVFDDVDCPVLVVHGRRDRIIPVNAARAAHDRLPGSRLLVHPTWGHCPQLDDPAGVTRLLVDFADDAEAVA